MRSALPRKRISASSAAPLAVRYTKLAVNKLIKDARTTLDQAERKQLYFDAQKIAHRLRVQTGATNLSVTGAVGGRSLSRGRWSGSWR